MPNWRFRGGRSSRAGPSTTSAWPQARCSADARPDPVLLGRNVAQPSLWRTAGHGRAYQFRTRWQATCRRRREKPSGLKLYNKTHLHPTPILAAFHSGNIDSANIAAWNCRDAQHMDYRPRALATLPSRLGRRTGRRHQRHPDHDTWAATMPVLTLVISTAAGVEAVSECLKCTCEHEALSQAPRAPGGAGERGKGWCYGMSLARCQNDQIPRVLPLATIAYSVIWVCADIVSIFMAAWCAASPPARRVVVRHHRGPLAVTSHCTPAG